MLIISGIRSFDFNIDTINYIDFHKTNSPAPFVEYLFFKSINLIRYKSLWLFIISALIYLPLIIVTDKNIKFVCLAAILFMISSNKFFTESFNIIRQCVAASFVLCTLVSYNKHKYKRMLVFLCIAIFFHFSSLILIPFLFIKRDFLPQKTISYFFVLATFIIGILGFTQLFIGSFFDLFSLINSNNNDINTTLDKYYLYSTNGVSFNRNFLIATCFPTSILCLITYPDTKLKKNKYNFYYIIFLISTCIANIVTSATQYGFRLMFSLLLVQILVLPLCYQYSKFKLKIIIIIFLIIQSFLYLYTLPTLLPSFTTNL